MPEKRIFRSSFLSLASVKDAADPATQAAAHAVAGPVRAQRVPLWCCWPAVLQGTLTDSAKPQKLPSEARVAASAGYVSCGSHTVYRQRLSCCLELDMYCSYSSVVERCFSTIVLRRHRPGVRSSLGACSTAVQKFCLGHLLMDHRHLVVSFFCLWFCVAGEPRSSHKQHGSGP